MIIAAFYDLASGEILQTTAGPASSVEADGRPFVALPQWRADWGKTHRVVDGRVVPRTDMPSPEDLAAQALQAQWVALRAQRDRLLAACDWTQGRDTPLAADLVAAWAAYRQALRDLPETLTDPTAVVWPPPPTANQDTP